ncbi:MAG: nucleoside deaminase [Actinobacteria bacterium]|nr:nucleoside deaminase [Actinomycetota bacterium]
MNRITEADRAYLSRAISLSKVSLEDDGKTPFGAVLVYGGEVAGEGTASVVEQDDPTAHAEIIALRRAGARLRRHLLEGSVMYSSSEPCPMCLAACYWARVARIVFGATSHDVAAHGFEDLRYYRELTSPPEHRTVSADAPDGALRGQATAVLRAWAELYPEPVEPKY